MGETAEEDVGEFEREAPAENVVVELRVFVGLTVGVFVTEDVDDDEAVFVAVDDDDAVFVAVIVCDGVLVGVDENEVVLEDDEVMVGERDGVAVRELVDDDGGPVIRYTYPFSAPKIILPSELIEGDDRIGPVFPPV